MWKLAVLHPESLQSLQSPGAEQACEGALPVVEQDVGALDVPVQEVLLVAVVQALHELPHEAADVLLGEGHQARLQQPHQVMVHVLKYQVKGTCATQRGRDKKVNNKKTQMKLERRTTSLLTD